MDGELIGDNVRFWNWVVWGADVLVLDIWLGFKDGVRYGGVEDSGDGNKEGSSVGCNEDNGNVVETGWFVARATGKLVGERVGEALAIPVDKKYAYNPSTKIM